MNSIWILQKSRRRPIAIKNEFSGIIITELAETSYRVVWKPVVLALELVEVDELLTAYVVLLL